MEYKVLVWEEERGKWKEDSTHLSYAAARARASKIVRQHPKVKIVEERDDGSY